MTDFWDQLDAAINADDPATVTRLLSPLSPGDRRLVWDRLDPFGGGLPYDYFSRDSLARAIAAVWTAPTADLFASRHWAVVPWDRLSEVEIADALQARAPRWLPKLNLLRDERRRRNWRLQRELHRRGVIERGDAADYLCGMVLEVRGSLREWTIRDALLADPALLDVEIYELFDHEEVGGLLAGQASYETTGEEDPNAYHAGRDNSWAWVLVDLAAEDRLDRARLLQGALDALLRDGTWPKRSWYALLIDRLEPSIDELDQHQSSYLRLLSATVSPAVGFAQQGVQRLLDADRLDPADLLAEGDGPFLRKEKVIALEQLRLLAPFLGSEAHRERAAVVISQGLTHQRADVQSKVLAALSRVATKLGPETRAVVATALESSAPSVRKAAGDAFGGRATAEPTAPTAEWTRPPAPGPPPDLTDDDAFSRALSDLMGRAPLQPMLLEAALDGLLRRAHLPPAEFRSRFGAVVKHARKAKRATGSVSRGVALLVLTSAGEPSEGRFGEPSISQLPQRMDEIRRRLQLGRADSLLSLPTDGAGRIDLATLSSRAAEGSADASVDLAVAEHRAGIRAPDFCEIGARRWTEPSARWSNADFYKGIAADDNYHSWDGHTLAPFDAFSHGLTVFPHDVEAVVGNQIEHLVRLADFETSSSGESLHGPLCEWLVTLDERVAPSGAAALVLALAAKATVIRLTAVDALITLLELDRLSAELLVDVAAAQAGGGVAKPSRLASALSEVSDVRPETARDLAVKIASRVTDHRDVGKLLLVAVELSTMLGTAFAPEEIRSLAERPSSSIAVRAARDLVRLADD